MNLTIKNEVIYLLIKLMQLIFIFFFFNCNFNIAIQYLIFGFNLSNAKETLSK